MRSAVVRLPLGAAYLPALPWLRPAAALRQRAAVRLPSHGRCASTPAVHPLAAAAGRGQHPPDARDQWRPHEMARLSAVRRPWSEKARSRARVRELRQSGMVPVTITTSGGRARDLPVAVSERALVDELERGAFFNRPFELEVSGNCGDGLDKTTYRVVPTQVNFHPVMNTPISVSFYQYTP